MEWKNCKIEDAPIAIIDGDRGKNYPKQGDFLNIGHCLFLNASNVTKKGFDFNNCQFISEDKDEKLRKGKLFQHDIVMTTRGTLGNVAYYHEKIGYEHIRINSGMVIFRCDRNKLLPNFFYLFICSPLFINQVNSLRSGVAQPQLPIKDIKTIKIKIPPLPIQQKIADILSKYDDLIENNRRRIELLERSARLLYKEWFVRLRFPGHEHTPIIDGIPEGWERLKLGEVLTLQRGFDLPSAKRTHGQYPIFASTGINGYHEKAKVQAPGIVTGRSGSLGKVMYIAEDFWPLNTTLYVKDFIKVDAVFALHLLENLHLEQYNSGAAVPTLNRNDIHKIKVLCPSCTLKSLFLAFANPIYTQIHFLDRYNQKLKQARDILLPKLMNGEIEV
ncbi:MAG: restriction endonuclease subunit S [Microcystis aeruginosa Ma_AC_P_19900807_S299]|jgi:type I restriction enzyme S subunit|uniref:Restriction endonuclease subunit S n=1 Tax=Microcystis aeruginosa Ma_SC_T_19800800_S464 TaxID=2486257 RepID=A0A552DJU1_MICAE|nr:MAG: restriction endonuclease subunit S [Microcystis aeruginosa Ma_AC_P_19900807_S299]TRU22479.1 MAG: restriction endonuclease subunit S [Microcystis aeruginosa Ma_SC_T_19800800_S464]